MRNKLIFIIIALISSLLMASKANTSEMDCSTDFECEIAKDTRNCQACILKNPFGGCVLRGNDLVCEMSKINQNMAYQFHYEECMAKKQAMRLECENKKSLASISTDSNKSLVKNGQSCESSYACQSGYCYPGIDKSRYCLHERFNCALKGKNGAMYGEIKKLDQKDYACIRPPYGPANWVKVEQ